MPNCMADEDDVWLPFSVGIDFDDNGKDKEKKHIMRHLKKTQSCISNHATLLSNLLSNVFLLGIRV